MRLSTPWSPAIKTFVLALNNFRAYLAVGPARRFPMATFGWPQSAVVSIFGLIQWMLEGLVSSFSAFFVAESFSGRTSYEQRSLDT